MRKSILRSKCESVVPICFGLVKDYRDRPG
jgi:hypothetical protein